MTLRNGAINPKKEEETFTWQVELVTTIVKQNCKALWSPSSHLVVDETIITYRDRTLYKVKLPNKPIKKDYKVWVLRDVGYVYDWLWHSHIYGPEDISLKNLNIDRVESTDLTKFIKVHLVSTFVFILRLVQRLRIIHLKRVFYFFLDNLFLNINVL